MKYSIFIFLVVVVVCINAHAVLVSPVPFNTNPTTISPCGVSTISSTMSNTSKAYWIPGSTVTIRWNLVASDGGGNVKGFFDPLGGTSFTVPAWTADFMTSGSNKFYNHTFIVPSTLSCNNSPSRLCTFKVNAGSWTSCTMIDICEDCDTPAPKSTTCTAIGSSKLSFCGNNITNAMITYGVSPIDVDAELSNTYKANLANPLVFQDNTSLTCQTSYKSLLCSLSLSSCDPSTGSAVSTSQACRAQCRKAMSACKVTEQHSYLYDCDSMPLCAGESSGDDSNSGMSAGGKAALSLFFIGLAGVACVAGYFYHKQGHLLGYTFDKESKKFVRVPANPHNYNAYVDPEDKM